MDFQVISKNPITNEILLGPPIPPRTISGARELLQIVVLSLLNTPGRNAQYPLMGSGIPAMIGQVNLSEKDTSEIFSILVGKVEKVKNEILEYQKALTKSSAAALLSDLLIINIESGATFDAISIRFRMITQDGSVEDFVI